MIDQAFFNEVLNGTGQLFLVVFALMLIERARPIEKAQPGAAVAFNLGISIVLLVCVLLSVRALCYLLPPLAVPTLIKIEPQSTWYGKLNCEFLYLLIFDFFSYWLHRLEHTLPPLWEVHKLHHEDEHLNVTTTNRHHPLEAFLKTAVVLLPMSLFIDIPLDTAIFGISLSALIPAFSHMNLRINLGPLTPLIVGPQLHRLHHSQQREHHNKNFANIFPLWDLLFGTYQAPAHNEFPATGLASNATK